jgi:hypothetical protein
VLDERVIMCYHILVLRAGAARYAGVAQSVEQLICNNTEVFRKR